MSIALVTQGYQSPGGVQTAARWLADGLRRKGYQVNVFDLATSRADRGSRLIISPATWLRSTLLASDPSEEALTHVGANGAELELLRYMPRSELTRALAEHDLIQVVAGGPALAYAASRSGRPVVLQVATTVARERASQLAACRGPLALWRKTMTRLVSHLERVALRHVNAVLVMNREMSDLVRSRTPATVVLAPPGVDTQTFRPRRSGWKADGYFLSVSRLNDPRKGLERLVEAYEVIRQSLPSAPALILAGTGAPPPELLELIARLELGRHVAVKSDVPQESLPALYRGASVYLQASYEEGFGISILEAMASGLPVVATRTAGTTETVEDGSSGYLVDQGPLVPHTLAASTIRILTDEPSRVARQSRSRVVERFSHEVSIARLTSVYDGLAGQNSTSHP